MYILDAAEQIRKFEEFIELHYLNELLENARKGLNVLSIDFIQLSKFDTELVDLLIEDPENVVAAAEAALTHFDIDSKSFRVRFKNLPKGFKTVIRDIRSKHIGKLILTDGVVRQKSPVRPQVTSARFECPACGNVLTVLQLDETFKEPSKCSCGRKGRFKLLSKELVDAQALVLEESSDDLEGGEQPKRMNIFLKNDLVSPLSEKRTNPGTKIIIVGILKEVPIPSKTGGKLTRFDLMIEANYVESVGEDFGEIKISEEERKEILEISRDPKLLPKLVNSIAPTIYGHDRVKEALLLQLVGGVRKRRGDGVNSRGDIHMLLIGDPGAGKCLHGNTKIFLENGKIVRIKELAQDAGLIDEVKDIGPVGITTVHFDGKMDGGKAIRVWRRKSEKTLLEITTRTGKTLKLTKNHPLFHIGNGYMVAKNAEDFVPGERIATPRRILTKGSIQRIKRFFPKKYSNNSKEYTYPEIIDNNLARFLGYLCGDGYISYSKTSGWISFTNNDEDLLSDFKRLAKILFRANPSARKSHRGKSAEETYFTSRAVVDYFVANFEEVTGKSNGKGIPAALEMSPNRILKEFILALFDCEAHLNARKRQIEFMTTSEGLAEDLQMLLLRFGVISSRKRKIKYAANTLERRKVPAFELTIAGEFVRIYAENLGFISKKKTKSLEKMVSSKAAYNTNVDLVPNVNGLLRFLRGELGLLQKEMGVPRPSFAHFEQNNRLPSVNMLKKITTHLRLAGKKSIYLDLLDEIAHADVFWDEILEIKETKADEEYVYDLEVEKTHNYVANGVVVHNSQLLKRVLNVSPKARYVSGKGASGAGLTAAVVKDEFLHGWSLEAGALVLANRGICLIDELDKMGKEDRSAMHEALEQQTITISKANIQATLNAETTVLAAANPKFGRFDPYGTIPEQIDLPNTLINRFDLIFPIKDIPDKNKDEDLASFILTLHREEKKEGDIETKMLRKYIAYARQQVFPALTEGAIEEIKSYYLKMRGSGTGDESGVKSIPISARQLEALVRLSEATARLRLADKVTRRDAKRAVDLLHYCLTQIGVDPETGQIDIDRISTGITSSQRGKLITVREIITELEAKIGKTIPIDDVIREALDKGIDAAEAEESIEKLKRSGDIYEPRRGFIQKI